MNITVGTHYDVLMMMKSTPHRGPTDAEKVKPGVTPAGEKLGAETRRRCRATNLPVPPQTGG